MYKHEHKLNGLLERLDRICSHGDVEVREKRKVIAKVVERALEGVKRVVGEVVGKRFSFVVSSTLATKEPPKGFTVERDAIEEPVPMSTKEQVVVLVTSNDVKTAGQSTPDQPEAAAITLEESHPPEETISEFRSPVASANAVKFWHMKVVNQMSYLTIGSLENTSRLVDVSLNWTINSTG